MSALIDGLGAERQADGGGRDIGADRSHAGTTHLWKSKNSRLGRGNTGRSEDTLRFAELTGVRPMIETYPLERRPRRMRG